MADELTQINEINDADAPVEDQTTVENTPENVETPLDTSESTDLSETDDVSNTADSSEISDVSDLFTAPVETESLTLSITDYGKIMVSSVPVGFLAGAIIMIVGYTVLGIVKILKSLS